MLKDKLFASLVKGTANMEDVREGTPDEIRQLLKNAASMINRSSDLVKVEKAMAIREEIAAYLKTLEGTKEQAVWHTAPPENLEFEDILKAIKSAQWYKHTYGPSAVNGWKKIVAAGNNHPMYQKARRNLDKAPELYAQSLKDEAYWLDVKDNFRGQTATQKVSSIKEEIAKLEALPKRTKAQDTVLETLKNILG
jgi:hypothetical protein